MKRPLLPSLIFIFLLSSSFTALWLGCGDDDDDDDDGGDGDDDAPTWAERCEAFVDAILDFCEAPSLFDLSRDDAENYCKDSVPEEVPWECIVECWESDLDCEIWFECITDDCGVETADDDTA
ncbi:MAG: hypothetical protein M5R36_19985 [Deltaproteobacteria bacterium]|nr:hypothetical protein [Deltaproteobacteria bacterium]